MKRVAILTSGGDAPGMNATIRAITRKAIYEGWEVMGVRRGFQGLVNGELIPLERRDVGSIVNRGGTMLKSARCPQFSELEYQQQALEQLQKHDVSALIVIGGDGSMRGAEALSKLGFPTITIPGTIDNDMNGTEYTIGFDTALNTVVEAVSKIRDTTTAHERVAIVEVMGRHAGHIAVASGVACGAEVVLTPERPIPLEQVKDKLIRTHESGKTYSIIIVAEGAYKAYDINAYLEENSYFKPSVTVLGYLQRGGSPSAKDAIMAALMGEKAIDCLLAGETNCLIGYVDSKVQAIPYEAAKTMEYPVEEELYHLISVLSL